MKTIIFDLDGTLLDVRARREAAKRRVESAEPLFGALHQTDIRQVIETRELLALDRVFEGAKNALEKISSNSDNSLILYTARQKRGSLLWQLQTLGLDPFFEHVINTYGETKQFSHVAHLIGQFSTGHLIGDSKEDEEVAREGALNFTLCPLALSNSREHEVTFFSSLLDQLGE
jgi:HAD superfamily hydrolase (TIGR01549 family)